MARVRQVKPDFFTDSKLAACGIEAMMLFEGLWLLADREGRLKDIPFWIHGQIFPFFPDYKVDDLLQKLAAAGFIIRYTVHTDLYIQVCNFKRHQNPHKKEADSVIPPPPIKIEKERKPRKAAKIPGLSEEIPGKGSAEPCGIRNTDSNTGIRKDADVVGSESPDHKAVTGYFFDEYKRRFGVSYPHAGGKDGATVKRIVGWASSGGISAEQIRACIDAFFETDDEWVQTKGGFTLSVLWLQLPKIAPRVLGNQKGKSSGANQQTLKAGGIGGRNSAGGIGAPAGKYDNIAARRSRAEDATADGCVGVAESPEGKKSG